MLYPHSPLHFWFSKFITGNNPSVLFQNYHRKLSIVMRRRRKGLTGQENSKSRTHARQSTHITSNLHRQEDFEKQKETLHKKSRPREIVVDDFDRGAGCLGRRQIPHGGRLAQQSPLGPTLK